MGQAARLLSSNSLRPIRKAVIAALQGVLAGGCGIATACDIIPASRSPQFGYSTVNIGLCFCDGDGDFVALGFRESGKRAKRSKKGRAVTPVPNSYFQNRSQKWCRKAALVLCFLQER
jgi:hypothetical protein